MIISQHKVTCDALDGAGDDLKGCTAKTTVTADGEALHYELGRRGWHVTGNVVFCPTHNPAPLDG